MTTADDTRTSARPPLGESTDGGTVAARPRPDGRLSPLVRRLLGEHGLRPEEVDGTGPRGRITPDDVHAASTAGPVAQRSRLSPLVKRLLREHELEPDDVHGTGSGGRITPDDVRAAATSSPEPQPHAQSRVESLTRPRKIIAERMLTSLQTTAQLTAAVEADLTRIMHLRSQLREAARTRFGMSLSPLAFAAKATCRTLLRHPVINASIDTDAGTVTFHRGVDLGIAVDTEHGLMVPVIRGAHELSVLALQERIDDLAARARSRELRPDDVGGATFTVSNTGSRGTLFDTPILNPPEAAILATPKIEKRPVVVTDDDGDRIAVRHRTYLCLSYDHRLIDGADAARFLTDLATQLDEADWEQELAELTPAPRRS